MSISTIKLTNQQIKAVDMVFENSISILTGKPGTGKTTTVKAIILRAEEERVSIRQAAPTGKAAKRMIESTGRKATTIHSALQAKMINGDFSFMVNADNPWPEKLVIIDEASMITTELFDHVMQGIDTSKTKLLLVGDTGQLPSIGGGAVLRDLIESGLIAHTELDIIHRNSGKIVEACASIHAGRSYSKSTQIDLDAENKINLVHIDCTDQDDILKAIETVVADRMPMRGYDPVWDVQVISPVNSKGALSCESINETLRARLNPTHALDPDGDKKWRVGDKVINTKNLKAMESLCLNDKGKKSLGEVMVVNGDIGEIVSAEEKKLIIDFYDPDRTVDIDRSKNNLLHAYCITCHRFQGSESPVIIIPIHSSFAFFANRSWIYTAISRAREICITIGDFSVIDAMVKNIRDARRVTMLKDKIVDKNNERELMVRYEGV